MCEQQRRRSACASVQADQCLCCSLKLVFFSTKKRLINLNGEQNDTRNLLVSHRICHFRAIQPFDSNCFWLHSGKEIICSNNIQRIKRGPPRGFGNRGIRPFISGEQGNKGLKLKGTGEQRQFWGIGNIEN